MTFRYNAVQALLALFTLFVVMSLVFSGIRNGLLATPNMASSTRVTAKGTCGGSRITRRA
jgi:hypothetical protein